MNLSITTTALALLTFSSLAASLVAILRFRQPATAPAYKKIEYSLLGFTALGATVLFIGRAIFITKTWQPLQSHVDGLLLITLAFAMLTPFLESRAKLSGITLFALPLITLILFMALIGHAFRYKPFAIGPAWRIVHLAGVYLGTIFFALGAIAGGMYLFVQRKLRKTHDLKSLANMASLEAIERLIIRSAALGFGLLSVGLFGGLIELTKVSDSLIPGWYHQPKILLSSIVWLIYAIVMNVKHATTFRGKRAAYMSIAGMILIMLTFAVVAALPPLVKTNTNNVSLNHNMDATLCPAVLGSPWRGQSLNRVPRTAKRSEVVRAQSINYSQNQKDS